MFMPRKVMKIPDHIECLSILDEHGRVDTKLMPVLVEDQLRYMHRIMLLSRRFDDWSKRPFSISRPRSNA